jgi:hypothetical protein
MIYPHDLNDAKKPYQQWWGFLAMRRLTPMGEQRHAPSVVALPTS